jgi:S-DNA-T family DNA segregation ATPase FtsK/SpoIIIE
MIKAGCEGGTMGLLAKIIFYIIGTALSLGALYFFVKVVWRVALTSSGERRREIVGLILAILTVLTFMCLVSYSPSDYFVISIGGAVHNYAGVIGGLAASFLLRAFGLLGFTIPLFMLAWTINRIRGGDMDLLARRTVLGLVLVALVDLSMSIVPLPVVPIGFRFAGKLGFLLAGFFTRLFGRTGSYVVTVGLLIAVLSSEAAVRRIPGRIFDFMRRRRVRVEFPKQAKPKPAPKKKEKPVVAEKPVVHAPVAVPQAEPIVEKATAPVPAAMLEGDLIDEAYQKEFLSILMEPQPVAPVETKDDLRRNSEALEKKLMDYGIGGKVVNVSAGPVITRYEFAPAPGVKVSRVAGLADDLALAMKAERIRIVAPIPGKAAIGIEIPNKKRAHVYLKENLTSESYLSSKSPLTVALGNDIAGEATFGDIASMPHLLIAGATGSGKSVAINSMVASILYRASPSEVRFLMIDPKRLELPVYNAVPHLLTPVLTESKASLDKLKEVLIWMDMRYREFAVAGVRDIEGYNSKMKNRKPYILIVVDELADLMITAPTEIEETLTRLAQMSRAVGIHLVLATQRPSVDVITGLIKANFPARIAFQVASKTDSRTILDMNGAEKLLGRGDMLFLPPGKGEPVRIHGAYISTQEAKRIAGLWQRKHLTTVLSEMFGKEQLGKAVQTVVEEDVIDCIVDRRTPGRREALTSLAQRFAAEELMEEKEAFDLLCDIDYYTKLDEETDKEGAEKGDAATDDGALDELFEEAKNLVLRHKIASVSLLQRRLKIGYARAGRLIDQLEKHGVVGPYSGSKAREVLVSEDSEVLS